MGMREALAALAEKRNLSDDDAQAAMQDVVSGAAAPNDVERLAAALRARGETADELTAMAQVVRRAALSVEADGPVLDTAGTGGDDKRSFNVSTVAAIVAAAAGVRVAKQHHRAVSSRCGSTDLLEEFGVAADLPPDAAARCLREAGLTFLSAPRLQPSTFGRFADAGRESDARALLHLLTLLANPARAQHQVIGVSDENQTELVAEVLRRLGTTHAVVIRGDDGMDEITCTKPTTVREVIGSEIKTWSIDPRDFGVELAPRHAILGGKPDENVLLAQFLLRGKSSPYRDVAELNAAAALLAADRVTSFADGFALARETIASGAARTKLQEVVELSQSLTARV
jgi:anthranilate phosphoribosyltransferase